MYPSAVTHPCTDMADALLRPVCCLMLQVWGSRDSQLDHQQQCLRNHLGDRRLRRHLDGHRAHSRCRSRRPRTQRRCSRHHGSRGRCSIRCLAVQCHYHQGHQACRAQCSSSKLLRSLGCLQVGRGHVAVISSCFSEQYQHVIVQPLISLHSMQQQHKPEPSPGVALPWSAGDAAPVVILHGFVRDLIRAAQHSTSK
jgi:hypothetical protein